MHRPTLDGTLRARKFLLLVVLTVLLFGCAVSTNPHSRGSAETDLLQWIDQDLIPYLVSELSQQPRFRREPVMLIALRDNDLRTELDQLSHEIRERIRDSLLASPGVELVRPAGVNAGQQTLRTENQLCDPTAAAQYLVGIDIEANSDAMARVRVRALDTSTGRWVTGFGRHWQGPLNDAQLFAFHNRFSNEELRGHRELPFLDNETDLLAIQLAQKISCALRDLKAPRKTVAIEVTAESRINNQGILDQVLELVMHNLVQLGMTTESDENPGLALTGNLNQIDGDLYQFWVKASSADIESPININAYVLLANSPDLAVMSAVPSASRVTQESNLEASTVGAAVSRSLQAEQGRVANEYPAIRAGAEAVELLSQPRLLGEQNTRNCGIQAYDRSRLPTTLSPNPECFAIEFDLYQAAYLHIIRHAVNGLLSSVPIDGCGSQGLEQRRHTAQPRLRVSGMLVSDNDWITQENIYTIAVTDKNAARKIAQHFALLPNRCEQQNTVMSVQEELDWLAQLDELITLIELNSDTIEWRSVEIASANL